MCFRRKGGRGNYCPELDVIEANKFAAQATPHVCNGQNNGQYGYNGYNNGRVYDDSGRYQRTCNDNLGCAARDNNRWNDPRGYGYAQGRNGNGAPNGQVCGKRSQRIDNWTTETLHLDCNGNVMFVTRHQR